MIDKSSYLVYLNRVVALKLYVCPYLVTPCGDFNLSPLDFEFLEMLNTSPVGVFN